MKASAEPYGLNLTQKDIDFRSNKTEQNFPEIYLLLNQFHI